MADTLKTGLILSGGGAKGAFAVGVVQYLYQAFRSTGWFSVIGGTSTGALIAPMAAMMGAPDERADQALETLKAIYTSVTTADILEKQCFFEFLGRQDCFYESDPLHDLVHRHFTPDMFAFLREDPTVYTYVVYTNFQDGRKYAVSPKDDGMDYQGFIQAMLASASVPVVMEATRINDAACYDGGVRDLLPFSHAIKQGADVLVPVFLDPDRFPATRNRFRRMDKVLLRTLSILVDEAGRNDYEMAQLINIAIRARRELDDALKEHPALRLALQQILAKPEYAPLFGPEKRLIKIVSGLRPAQPLTDNSLEFDPVKMRMWLKQGYQVAERVLPGSPFIAEPQADLRASLNI